MAATTLRLPPLPTIRDLVKLYKLQAKKQLSQNFLMDERLTDKIVKQAGKLQDHQVVEVGPGPGGLTRSIIRRLPKRLIVVEKDTRFAPTLDMLAEAFGAVNGKMDIIYDDILQTNLTTIISEDDKVKWEDRCPKITVIGNLPFSVSTPLIVKWLHAISERNSFWSFGRTRMILTFQKEVAERLVAQPNQDQRCRLSVMAQAWTVPKLRFVIPGSAFVPAPDVDVGVVSFDPLIEPRTNHDFKFFEKITRHMFSFRQKYSIRCAETLFPPECREELSIMMYKLTDLDPHLRPFQMTVEDIHRLGVAYKYLLEKHPHIKDYNYRASRRIISPKKYLRSVHVEEVLEEDDFVEHHEPPLDDNQSKAVC